MARLEAPTARAARLWPAAPALHLASGTLSFRDLEALVCEAVQRLRARGLRRGDRVGVLGDNGLGWVVAAFAIPRAGGVLLPLNTRLQPHERAIILTDAGAAFHLDAADIAPSDLTPADRARADGAPGDRAPSGHLDPRRAHTILYTSGTTGRPKGAILTWSNHLASAIATREALALTPGDCWLCAMPLFHAGGLAILYRMALVGGAVALVPRFLEEDVATAIQTWPVTVASFTATMFRRIVATFRAPPPAIRAILVGGEAVPADLRANAWPLRATYGLSETASHVTIAHTGDPATCGLPTRCTQVAIRDGRIHVRGPTLMRKYYRESGGPDEAGWFDTGDHGSLDGAGCLAVLGRRTDLIVSGGENVYPAEIEAALLAHPDVAEAAVVPAAEPTWGQVGVAYVVARTPQLRPEDLLAHLRQRLAGFKVPAAVRLRTALPHTASGKIDRMALTQP